MTTDEAAIEAMARAIFHEDSGAIHPDWEGQHHAMKRVWKAYATAALAALREMEGRDG